MLLLLSFIVTSVIAITIIRFGYAYVSGYTGPGGKELLGPPVSPGRPVGGGPTQIPPVRPVGGEQIHIPGIPAHIYADLIHASLNAQAIQALLLRRRSGGTHDRELVYGVHGPLHWGTIYKDDNLINREIAVCSIQDRSGCSVFEKWEYREKIFRHRHDRKSVRTDNANKALLNINGYRNLNKKQIERTTTYEIRQIRRAWGRT